MTDKEIVVKFLDGFKQSGKIQQSLNLLAEDYTFRNPMLRLRSKEAFMELAFQIGKTLTALRIIKIVAEEPWVAVWYAFDTDIPGLESTTATEWFRLESGKIQESELIYDASDWRKVYGTL